MKTFYAEEEELVIRNPGVWIILKRLLYDRKHMYGLGLTDSQGVLTSLCGHISEITSDCRVMLEDSAK